MCHYTKAAPPRCRRIWITLAMPRTKLRRCSKAPVARALANGLGLPAFTSVLKYGLAIGLADMKLLGPHVCRATAATTALERGADIAKVQEWLGHSSISTTRLYDRRRTKPEDSPTFKVSY